MFYILMSIESGEKEEEHKTHYWTKILLTQVEEQLKPGENNRQVWSITLTSFYSSDPAQVT